MPLDPLSPRPESLGGRVSVAMATYNGGRFLREQLNSIARQTLLPCEIVITDDGSTDNTLRIVADFAASAPFPIRLHRNPSRLGYPNNFLHAASLCAGELIAFCDQDDLWTQGKLEVCCKPFRDPAVLLAVHSSQTLLPSGQRGGWFPRFHRSAIWKPGTLDPFTICPGFVMLFRRDLLRAADPAARPLHLWSHDHWIWFLAASIGRVATLPQMLCLYRQHQTNVWGAPAARGLTRKLEVLAEIPDYEEIAATEDACAHVLTQAMQVCPAHWRSALRAGADRLALRAHLHRIRSTVYEPGTSARTRFRIFVHLLGRGAYRLDSSKTTLGPAAALKDILWGLTGLAALVHRFRPDLFCNRERGRRIFPPFAFPQATPTPPDPAANLPPQSHQRPTPAETAPAHLSG